MRCVGVMVLFLAFHAVMVRNEGSIYLGGIFDKNADDEDFFVKAVESLGPSFQAVTAKIQDGAFAAMLATCSLLTERVAVVFGPRNRTSIHIVESICDYKDITHVITRWVFAPEHHDGTINFYPHFDYLNQAYFDVVRSWECRSVTLFYEDDESLLRLADLVKRTKQAGIVVSVQQLDETGNGIYRTTLKKALQSGETNYVIDCSVEILQDVLHQAQQVGLMTGKYSFFITNLDVQEINIEPFQYSEANITGLRIVDPDSELYADTLEKLAIDEEVTMRTETALLIDAVTAVGSVIANMSLEDLGSHTIDCNSPDTARHGITLSNKIKGRKHVGLTGLIEFNNEGFRSNLNLDVLKVHEEGLLKIGTWNASRGLTTSNTRSEVVEDDPNSLRNKSFRVLTCLTAPYCMLKEMTSPLFGNDRFEGFAIDLIQELAVMEGFNFTILIREDKDNSAMLDDVIHNQADLAITDLTITADREEKVDFTSPFMNLGISILAKKPTQAPPSFFSFADPFAIDTWLMLALAYVIVSLSFFILGRLSPDEWTNPYPCIEEPEYLINQFSLVNSAWYAIGSLMQQGSEIAPIAISTRMVGGMWYFFVLIMVSSYTANLAAFLATENNVELFQDVYSLIANREKYDIKIGAKRQGATWKFFKNKSDVTYQAIEAYMEAHPQDLVEDNNRGVKQAEEETYAFFMESTSIEYEIQRHCELQQYGKNLDDKGYGIAMRKNSSYRKKLSTAILTLQSSGEIDNLKRRWWEEKRGGGQCSSAGDSQEATSLGLKNVEGVFYVTIGGTVISIFCVIVEMFLSTRRSSRRARITFGKALKGEMSAYVNFSSNVKPAVNEKSESKSGSGSTRRSETFNNNLKAPTYGFIPAITKEELPDE